MLQILPIKVFIYIKCLQYTGGEKKTKNTSIITIESLLIIILLITFIILVNVTLFAQASGGRQFNYSKRDLLNYRQSILATIIMAFGAWIGAGVSFFFGRENLREATPKMLQMHERFLDD